MTAKSLSINDAERKSGGCAREAVKLTSGGLSHVSGIGTEQVARLVIVRQKSAKGVVSGVGIRGETLVRKGEKRPVSLESVTIREGPNGPRKGLNGAVSTTRIS
jgi:hypothetical protein